MKLQLRRLRDAHVPGGTAFVLTDETGAMFPNQQSVKVEQSVDAVGAVTVTFLIDGDRVSIVADLATSQ